MKIQTGRIIRRVIISILFCAFATVVRAQTSDDATSLEAEAAGLSLLPSDEIPATGGTFWLVTSPTNGANGIMAPLPCPPPNVSGDSFYIMAPGIYLVDAANDANASPSEIEAQANAVSNLITQVQATTATAQTSRAMGVRALDDSGPPSFSDTNGDGGDYYTNLFSLPPINTNILWLQITNVANGLAYLNLNKATDSVFAILGTTNLLTPFTNWQIFTEVWPTNGTTNLLSFTVNTSDNTNLFWRAEDWTGVYLNGLPEWWTWLNFGNLSESASDLDSSGNNTLGHDFTNNLDPNVIYFSLVVTNNYVNSMNAPVQLNITGGSPSFVAVSVDDTNYANDADWRPFASTNLNANLGLVQGWHNVWVGLKGFPTNATVTWQEKQLNLDSTPPVLVITNPAISTVGVPMIQLQGYSSESLSSISYDITNAAGLLTNQSALVVDQYYDTNTLEFTTNYFQCYDVPFTNGVNTITLHATDWAGNVTTTNFSYTLVLNTNPPVVNLYWPQNGMQISSYSASSVWRGWVSDPTASIAVQIVDTNGNTNMFYGAAGRDGNFYVTVPLASGTNTYTLTAQDQAGNVTSTNLTVMQSSVNFSVNAVKAGQTTVTGSINDSGYTVWANGVMATNNGDGTWTTQITPIDVGGGTVEAEAIPNNDNGGNGSGGGEAGNGSGSSGNPNSASAVAAQTTVNAPQGVFISTYHLNDVVTYLEEAGATPWLFTNIVNWQDGVGGNGVNFAMYYAYTADLIDSSWLASSWPQSPSGPSMEIYGLVQNGSYSSLIYASTNYGTSGPTLNQEHCDFNHTTTFDNDPVYNETRTADTEMKLATGGPSGSTRRNLWRISG
ncbi:MAG: hypothetical protein ABSF34_06325, partial [Verrucomicrobiota bacterium]